MIRRYKNVKIRRRVKVRSKIKGTAKRPRLSVFRSNKAIYAQLIDDKKGQTLASASEKGLTKASKTEKAKLVGEALAKKGIKKGIKKVVFDRGPYRFHGRIKALAEGARQEGLRF